MLRKLRFRPGIVRDTTDYANNFGWFDCDKIRFRNGFPEQLGGWVKDSTNQFIGPSARHLNRQTDLSGSNVLFICDTVKSYIDTGDNFVDVTPIRETNALALDPIDTTISSTTILFNDGGSEAGIGDYVIVSGATATNGVPADEINAEHVVTAAGAGTFSVEVTTAATSTGSGGGASVSVDYLYFSGVDTVVGGTGWGSDAWNDGAWGEAGSSVAGLGNLRLWSSAPFGEDIVYAPRNGPLFYWDATNPTTRATFVSAMGGAADVPAEVLKVIVSERDRHVVALGATLIGGSVFDPMLIRWSDQEDVDDWTPTTTNTSGSLRPSDGSRIITGLQTRQEVLVWTDRALYGLRYIGGTLIFGLPLIAKGVDIAGFNSAVIVNDLAYWISKSGFYRYDGRVTELPCPIEKFIREDVDWAQQDKIYAGSIIDENEVIWLYQSNDGTNNDKYVIFNYRDNTWYFGTLERTSWLDDKISGYPIAAGTDLFIYAHEFGVNDGSQDPAMAINGFIESSPMEISSDDNPDGTSFYFIDKLIPDVTFLESTNGSPSVKMTLKASNYPGTNIINSEESTFTRTATVPVEQYTEFKNVRLRGRTFRLRVEGTTSDTTWRLGTPRVNIRSDGRK